MLSCSAVKVSKAKHKNVVEMGDLLHGNVRRMK